MKSWSGSKIVFFVLLVQSITLFHIVMLTHSTANEVRMIPDGKVDREGLVADNVSAGLLRFM